MQKLDSKTKLEKACEIWKNQRKGSLSDQKNNFRLPSSSSAALPARKTQIRSQDCPLVIPPAALHPREALHDL